MKNREALISKIKALLSKTVENGCTHQEMLAALEKVQQLREAHGITERELSSGAGDAGVGHIKHRGADPLGAKDFLGAAIAGFCQVKMWRQADGFYIAGMRSDVEMADYLMEVLAGFVSRELEIYMTGNGATGDRRRRMEAGFVMGACRTLRERLAAITEAAQARQAGTAGQAVTIHKRALTAAYLASIGFQDARRRQVKARVHGDARAAGLEAGERASLNRPIQGRRE